MGKKVGRGLPRRMIEKKASHKVDIKWVLLQFCHCVQLVPAACVCIGSTNNNTREEREKDNGNDGHDDCWELEIVHCLICLLIFHVSSERCTLLSVFIPRTGHIYNSVVSVLLLTSTLLWSGQKRESRRTDKDPRNDRPPSNSVSNQLFSTLSTTIVGTQQQQQEKRLWRTHL